MTLSGGGVCGDLVRGFDWSATSLGPIEAWSPELRATVSNVVNSPVAKVLMWGPDHIMIYNDAYIDIAGTYHPRAMGGTVPGIWPEIWDWNRVILERGLRGEVQSFRDQPMTLLRSGVPEQVYLDLFYTPVYEEGGTVGGVLCTLLDNTDRLQLERRLAASEAELRAVTDVLPVLVAFIDRDHIYRFANEYYREWFGLTPAQVVGRHAREVIGEANYAARQSMMDRALAGETIASDATIQHGDGGWRRADVRYLPRREADGSVSGFHVLVFDVEERAQREQALAAANARFRAAMDAMHGVLWTNDAAGRMIGEQPGWAALTGQSYDEYQDFGWASA
ncbi:hypothetical protein LTR94_024670, partial [Friedmanniomyces endolithicus]